MQKNRPWTLLVGALGCMAGGVAAQQGYQPPAQVPPASYRQAQFVDSNGCVFIRAGVGNAVTWVPRVTRDRRQICGLPPTFGAASVTASTPAQTSVAASTSPEILTVDAGAVRTSTRVSPAPRVDPVVVNPSVVGTLVTPGTAPSKGVSQSARILPKHLYEERANRSEVKTPKGYRPAWQDDRLNPRRAEQNLTGHAAMKRIWTLETPQRAAD